MSRIRIGIVGGGAAGMMAAITAARGGADVTILEGGERLGKKLLSTGNGKCNLGNEALSADAYCGSKREWIAQCLEAFGTEETKSFFQDIGLVLHANKGYLYPRAEQASVVLDVLRTEIKILGIQIISECKVKKIVKKGNGTFLIEDAGRTLVFDRIILSCGGMAAPRTGSDGSGYDLAKQFGHTIVPVVPALVQLKCQEGFLKEISGVRCDACVSILDHAGKCFTKERGELQLTDYGISGIPVFQLSRKVNYLLWEHRKDKNVCIEAEIDFLPEYSEIQWETLKTVRRQLLSVRTVEEYFSGVLNKKLMNLFCKLAGLKREERACEVRPEQLDKVFSMCRHFLVHITGSNPFENAQTSAGGVDTAEVTLHMESRLCGGLYFAGELLDVDGRCGGYNLQWAWTSGYLAGMYAAGKENSDN